MRKLILALAVVLGCTSGAWGESDSGRYKIYSAQIEENKGKYAPISIMLDTCTGRTWYLSSSRMWYPMPVFSEQPQIKHDEMKRFGADYKPNEVR